MRSYTEYHPRWERPHMSTYWWMQRGSYFIFILRELSSIFVAWFVIYLLMLVRALGHGTLAYHQFLDWARNPSILLLNVVSLFFVVFHAITWFNLAPQAMVVHVGKRRLAGSWIVASNYAAWIVVSMVILGLLLIR